MRIHVLLRPTLAAALVLTGACGSSSADPGPERIVVAASPDLPAPDAPARPAWLGTRPLPLRPDGFGEMLPTPPQLQDRRLPTIDLLPPPPDGGFHSAIVPVPPDVVARSTWSPACPVTLEDLRYLTVSFWGFDDRAHTGELIVNSTVAGGVVSVFRRLFEMRFPVEEMRVTTPAELDAHPTGDGNNTGGFVCRPTRASSSWSEHAYGKALDVNPFHNPYVRRDVVLPELASAYIDRTWERPGMISPGVVDSFRDAGWKWGGHWTASKDWMHFSTSGR